MFFLNFLCVDYYYGYYCCDDYWYGSGWAIAVYVFLGLICISIIICCIVPIQFTTIIFHLTTISYVWASQKSFLHHICHYFCKLKRCRPLLPARTTAAPSMTPWSSRPPSKLPSLALPVRVNTRSFFSCQNKFHRAFSVVSTHTFQFCPAWIMISFENCPGYSQVVQGGEYTVQGAPVGGTVQGQPVGLVGYARYRFG